MSDANPCMQTASGIAFDLVEPTPGMINFDDIAEHLGKIARFAGATPGHFYSVAEHCVRAARHAAADGASDVDVAAVLLHDAHEAYIVDHITPERWALEMLARESYGEAGETVIRAIPKVIRHRIDRAVHAAAGLAWPLPVETREWIKRIDLRMLATERRDLMRKSDVPWPHLACIEPFPDRIAPDSWAEAWRQFRESVKRYVPSQRERAA